MATSNMHLNKWKTSTKTLKTRNLSIELNKDLHNITLQDGGGDNTTLNFRLVCRRNCKVYHKSPCRVFQTFVEETALFITEVVCSLNVNPLTHPSTYGLQRSLLQLSNIGSFLWPSQYELITYGPLPSKLPKLPGINHHLACQFPIFSIIHIKIKPLHCKKFRPWRKLTRISPVHVSLRHTFLIVRYSFHKKCLFFSLEDNTFSHGYQKTYLSLPW